MDGYNIIFAWDELKELAAINLDSARGRLLDILCNYQAMTKCNLIAVIVVGLVLGNGALFFGRQLLSIYTENPAVIDTGMKRMNVIARTYALCGMMDVMVGSLRGLGYSVMPMIVSLIGACGLRLLWIFTFFRMEQFHTVTSLYLTYTWSWIITFSAHVICWIIVRRKLGRQWNS